MNKPELNGRFPMWGGDPWLEPLDARQRRAERRRRACRMKRRNFRRAFKFASWKNTIRALLFMRVKFDPEDARRRRALCTAPFDISNAISRP